MDPKIAQNDKDRDTLILFRIADILHKDIPDSVKTMMIKRAAEA